jgi:transcriptional regulator with XRE-family HTH domain
MQAGTRGSPDVVELIRLERRCFAAKIRAARAILGWSQSEFGQHVGLTQRAIHKLEQGETDPRRTTLRAIEVVWQAQGIEFEDMADGGFRVIVRAHVVDRRADCADRRRQTESTRSGVGSLAAHIHSA